MIQGPQLFIVLAIVLLLFGGSQLPKLARSLGQAQKEFKDGLKEGEAADPPIANASAHTPPPVVDTPRPATPADQPGPTVAPVDDDPARDT